MASCVWIAPGARLIAGWAAVVFKHIAKYGILLDVMKKLYLLFTLLCVSTLCSARLVLPSYWIDYFDQVHVGMQSSEAWFDVDREQLMTRFGEYEQSIDRMQLFAPDTITNRQPVVFALVHGTWANNHPDFFDEASLYYRGVKKLAQDLAFHLKAPIELVSYAWSGGNTFIDRYHAGKRLASLLNDYYGPLNSYRMAYAYAHSHGCNVINIASQELVFGLDTLYYVASPVIEASESLYRPDNFRSLYNMYSDEDIVQWAGAINRKSSKQSVAGFLAGARVYEAQQGRDVFNIRLRFDGKVPGHVKIKKVAPQVLRLIKVVREGYHHHTSLVANLFLSEHGRDPLVAIHEQISLEKALETVALEKRTSQRVAQRLARELACSHHNERWYNKIYRGRSIHYVSKWYKQVARNWREIKEVFYEWMGLDEERENTDSFLYEY